MAMLAFCTDPEGLKGPTYAQTYVLIWVMAYVLIGAIAGSALSHGITQFGIMRFCQKAGKPGKIVTFKMILTWLQISPYFIIRNDVLLKFFCVWVQGIIALKLPQSEIFI